MNIIQVTITAIDANIAIVVSRFNKFINENLLEGAIDVLKRMGQVQDENITVVWVPGAYELPLIADVLAKTNRYDAIIALGTVIRGNTSHSEHIAYNASNGLSHVAQNTNVPIGFGILTTENVEQAIERAGTKSGNKGAEAALAILEMINIIKAIQV